MPLPGLPPAGLPPPGLSPRFAPTRLPLPGLPPPGLPPPGLPCQVAPPGLPPPGLPARMPRFVPAIFNMFNLHFLSSNIPLRNSTNNKMAFIISKDFYGKILILDLYLLQIHFGFSSFSHPVNAVEACGLLTPLHNVPEWFLMPICYAKSCTK